jgi:hypothetical protein
MSGLKKATGKYRLNSAGKYDCPMPGCNRRGAKGFATPQGVGAHIRTDHKHATATVGAANGDHADEGDEQDRPTPADLERMNEGTGFDTPRIEAPPSLGGVPAPLPNRATAAIVALLQLPELRAMPMTSVPDVFKTVQAIMELDGGRAIAPDLHAERQSANGPAAIH